MEEHSGDVERWKEGRIQQLSEPDSWLSVIGLHWIYPGETTMGSDQGMGVVLQGEDVPAWLGTLTLSGQGSFEWSFSPEVAEGMEPAAAETVRFRLDSDSGPPVFSWGTFSWFVIERYGEYAIRLKDSASEALLAFEGLESFDTDLRWRIAGRFDRYDPPRDIPNPNVLDVPSTSTSPGAAVFEVDGEEFRLDLTGDPNSGFLFLVFGDETNGADTYPGGRFLGVEGPDANGWVILDFNKAYNPPCVFTMYATCPLPPPQNKIPIRIDAGEKMHIGIGH